MSSADTSISIRGLGKTYELRRSSNTLRHRLTHVWHRERAIEVQALHGIDLDIDRGDCVGLIGSNGAGKSTLLKVISKIVWPSTGRVEIRGRLSAMLEVGTGFYPDLTGRENVYMSGALLGMSRSDIRQHFDQIVDFAGIGAYIDSPVRYYSSGMYVRLGFAVANFLRQDIVVIDEVLAVGDQLFREQCIAMLQSQRMHGDKTYLMVSHQLPMIAELCDRSIWLDQGRVAYDGSSSEAIRRYLSRSDTGPVGTYTSDTLHVERPMIDDQAADIVHTQSGRSVTIDIRWRSEGILHDPLIRLQIRQGVQRIAVLNNVMTRDHMHGILGEHRALCTIDRLPLQAGRYEVDLDIVDRGKTHIAIQSYLVLEVGDGPYYPSSRLPHVSRGPLLIDYSWHIS